MSTKPGSAYTPYNTPLRSKRNFKALGLALPDDPIPSPRDPVASRPAPRPGVAKKRPPPLGEGTNSNGFTLDPTLPPESPVTGRRSAMHKTLSNTLAKLDLKAEMPKLDLKNSDLRKLAELGQGNGGSVIKVEHIPTGTIMAMKIVLIDAKSSVQKQILRELQIMHDCHSEYIVSCFGSFLSEPNICICMEFMDKGSFDGIYKKIGAIDINVVCMVAHSVLEGLTYLYDVHRIIHRDIKPSNILCNSQGSIKLSDFGVSGELINSLANTFVGTSVYMSPERIQGAEYTVKSDIWSLGITLIELAYGRPPFSEPLTDDDDDLSDLEDDYPNSFDSGDGTPTHYSFASVKKEERRLSRLKTKGVENQGEVVSLSIIELMHRIVSEPSPRLGSQYDEEAQEVVDACLAKDPDERHTFRTLLEYRWMDEARDSNIDVAAWTNTF
jgi:mitogen-activated protein kinase kinase